MKTVKDFIVRVKVTYRVGLGDVEMPQKVYDQILEAEENGDVIDISDPRKYADAVDWLNDNLWNY